jgi:hypothetical protein
MRYPTNVVFCIPPKPGTKTAVLAGTGWSFLIPCKLNTGLPWGGNRRQIVPGRCHWPETRVRRNAQEDSITGLQPEANESNGTVLLIFPGINWTMGGVLHRTAPM